MAFVSYLVENKIISSQHIATIASEEFGVPLFDIDTMNIELSATKLISEKLIRQHNALPLYQRGKRLYDIGVDYAQGYGIGLPCPLNEI